MEDAGRRPHRRRRRRRSCMFFPLYLLHTSDLAATPASAASAARTLSAPQAGLMATLSQGIVGGEMAWPLVLVGIAMGISLHPRPGQEPDALLGRHVPAARDDLRHLRRRPHPRLRRQAGQRSAATTTAQKARVENAGVLAASGLIAGEALMGLVAAGVVAFRRGRRRTSRRSKRVPADAGFAGRRGSRSRSCSSCSRTSSTSRSARRARPTSRPRRRRSCSVLSGGGPRAGPLASMEGA